MTTTKTPLQLGMIGLGRMGANMVRRLMRAGHTCVVGPCLWAVGALRGSIRTEGGSREPGAGSEERGFRPSRPVARRRLVASRAAVE